MLHFMSPSRVIAGWLRLALLSGLLWWGAVSAAEGASRVLFLGDSFSKGAFGKTLDASMRASGLEVYTSVTGGASAYDWLPEFGATSCNIGYWEKTPKREYRVNYIARVPKLDDMVTRWKPNVVVIQGGTNMYSVLTSKRRPKEGNIAELERLLGRIGDICASQGAKLYWITPASAHPKRFSPELQAEMRTILQRVVSRYGAVYDSYAVTRFKDPYPGTDGIHYGPTDAARWSQLVARDLIPYAKGNGSRPAIRPRERDRDREDDGGKRRGFWDLFRRGDKAQRQDEPPAPRAPAAPSRRTERPVAPPADPTLPPRNEGRTPPPPAVRRAESTAPPAAPAASHDVLEVEVVLRRKPEKRTLAEITYRSALGLFEYDVIRVHRGNYAPSTIRIAHLIVMNKRYTSMIDRPLGSRMTLALEPLSKYPNLEKLQTVDDLAPAYDLPLFVPKL